LRARGEGDALVGGTRHPDVQPLPGPLAHLALVDAEHGAPFEALAAEDVPVEHVVVLPERPPVGLLVVVRTGASPSASG
jgi:hypothetical protein